MIPSVLLSVIAIRSLSREEAYIEKRLQDTLLLEVTHVSSVIANELNAIQKELNSSAVSLTLDNPDYSLRQWKAKNRLIDVPFVVSGSGEILYPRYDAISDNAEKAFLDWNKQFFRDEVKIPVYENIAVVYKEEIARKDKNKNMLISDSRFQDEKASWRGPVTSKKSVDVYSEQYQTQQAITSFEQSVPLRQEIYEQAKQTGKNIALRKVQVEEQKDLGQMATSLQQESIFISEPLSFSQIISKTIPGLFRVP